MARTNTSQIPLVYRLHHLYLEPAMAFSGAILCHFNPVLFLNTMTAATYEPTSQVIFDQLAATYVLFAFNEAVVLRVTDSLKMWRTILTGLLIYDFLHLYASWCVLGTKVFFSPWLWRSEDWVNLGSLIVPVVLRAAFLAGVGFNGLGGRKNVKRT